MLAFDYGTRRTGVALGVSGHVRPLEIITTYKNLPDKRKLDQLIDQWQPGGFIVGYPAGTPLQIIVDKATAFANWLEKTYHLPAELIDESYSSCVIEKTKGEAIDHLSAAIIMQQWYHQHKVDRK